MKKISFLAIFLLVTIVGWTQGIEKQKKMDNKATRVEMVTSEGRMVFELYNDTPLHRDNFLKLVNEHIYDGLLFHRVIRNFMIQGGDPDSRNAKPDQMLGGGTLGYTVPAEFRPNHIHKKGALCAARQGDNVNPKKALSASQFYVVQGQVWQDAMLNQMEVSYGKKFSDVQRKVYTTVGGTPHLDGDYTVFGELVEGMEVLDKIAGVPTNRANRPLEDVKILRVTVLK